MAETASAATQEQLSPLHIVQQLSRQLLATWQEQDPVNALRKTLEEILRQVDEEVIPEQEISAVVHIYEAASGFHGGVARGRLKDYMEDKPPRPDGTAVYAIQNRQPLFVDDSSEMPEGAPPLSDAAGEQDVRAFANLPLIVGDRDTGPVVGVLIINLREPYTFDENLQEVLGLFADRAAIALQAARVHRRRLREEQALQAISQSVATGRLQKAADEIVRQAADLTGADYVSFWSADDAQAHLVLRGVYAIQSGYPDVDAELPVDDHSINGHTFLTQQPHYAPDIKRDPHHRPWDKATRSAFCVPLLAQDQPIGTLYVASERPDGIPPEQRSFIERMAPHAAIALQNARLLEQENFQRQRAEAFQAIVAQIHRVIDEEQVGNAILEQLEKVIPFRTASLQVIRGDQRRLFAARGFKIAEADPELIKPLSDDPLVAEVVSSKAPKILSKVSWKRLPQVRSWCVVPLVVDDKVVGLLTLDHEKSGFYSEQAHKELLTSFANHAALALRDAQRNRDLDTLNHFALQLSQPIATQAVYDTLVQAVVDTLQCDYCTVFEGQPDGTLTPQAAGGTMFEQPPQVSFAPGAGLAGWVYRQGQAVLIANTAKDSRYQRAERESQAIKPRSIVLAPLRRDAKVIGVVSADYDRSDAFDENDKRLLETLAAHAGLALEKAQFLSDLQTLHDASSELAKQPEFKQIYHTAVESAARTLHCTHSTLFIFDRTAGQLVARARVGGATADVAQIRRFRRGEGLAGVALVEGQPLLVNDTANDDRFVAGSSAPKSRSRSMALAPVRVNGNAVGVLAVDKDEIDGFTERDRDMLATLALDVGIAINARRYQNRLRAIVEFQQVTSDVVDVQAQLQQIYEQLRTLMDVSGLYIGLYDKDSQMIEFPLAYQNGKLIADEVKVGQSPYAPRHFGEPSGLTEWVITKKEPLLVEDVAAWEGKEQIDASLVEGLRCCLVAPLTRKGEVIGVIGLQNFERSHVFTDDNLELLTAIANHAAIAIENARQYDLINNRLARRISELEAVSEFQQRISGIGPLGKEIQEIYDTAQQVLSALVDTRNMYIALYDEVNQQISFPLVYLKGNLVPNEEKAAESAWATRTLEDRDGLTEWIIRHKNAILIKDRDDAQAWSERLEDLAIDDEPVVKSWLGAPLLLGEKVTGVIGLQHYEAEGEFDEEHRDLLTLVARQAAIAIDNAQKYEEIQERKTEWEAISQLQRGVSEVVPVEQQLQTIYQATAKAMSDLMDTRNIYIALFDKDANQFEFALVYEEGEPVALEKRRDYSKRRRLGERRGLTDWIIENKQPVLIEREFVAEARRRGIEVYEDEGTQCWLGAPMLLRGEVVGVIGLQNFEREAVYDEHHRELLTTIASQAAIAIENARQYDLINNQLARRVKELEAVNRLQRAMSSLESVSETGREVPVREDARS